jgi:hypothetical protein
MLLLAEEFRRTGLWMMIRIIFADRDLMLEGILYRGCSSTVEKGDDKGLDGIQVSQYIVKS